MVNRKESSYKEQGERLRDIRKELDLTKERVSKECGIDPKTLYRYEHGLSSPGLMYLRYLHDKRKVNLNYIFGGEDRKFMLCTGNNPPDFGNLQELVYKMLRLMAGSAYICFSILAYAARLSEEM